MYYYNARYYDGEIGRFVTADNIFPYEDDTQSWNRYGYCRNNPIIYKDPTGHEEIPYFNFTDSPFVAIEKKLDMRNQKAAVKVKENPNATGLVSGVTGMIDGWLGMRVIKDDGARCTKKYITEDSKDIMKRNYEIGYQFGKKLGYANLGAGVLKTALRAGTVKELLGSGKDIIVGIKDEIKPETDIPAKVRSLSHGAGYFTGGQIKTLVDGWIHSESDKSDGGVSGNGKQKEKK